MKLLEWLGRSKETVALSKTLEEMRRSNEQTVEIARKAKEQCDAMKAAEEKRAEMVAQREAARQHAAVAFAASNAQWIKDGCPTQSAVTISKPIAFRH